jgi:hypothetical protein
MAQLGFGYDATTFLITTPKSVWTQLAEVRYCTSMVMFYY